MNYVNHNKAKKFKVTFLNLPVNLSINFFINFFFFFHIYKMHKNLLAKYYLENKQRLHKKLVKYIKLFLKKQKEKATVWL